MDDLQTIWHRLKLAFGYVNILFSHMLDVVEEGDQIRKIKSDEKLILAMTRFKNAMIDM